MVLSRHSRVGIGRGQRSRGARACLISLAGEEGLMSNLGTATIPLGRKEHGGSRKSHRGPVSGGYCDWKGHTRGIWSALGRIRQALRHEADRYRYKQRAGGRFWLSLERRSEVFSRHRSAPERSNPKYSGDDIRRAAGRWEFGAGLRPIYRFTNVPPAPGVPLPTGTGVRTAQSALQAGPRRAIPASDTRTSCWAACRA